MFDLGDLGAETALASARAEITTLSSRVATLTQKTILLTKENLTLKEGSYRMDGEIAGLKLTLAYYVKAEVEGGGNPDGKLVA